MSTFFFDFGAETDGSGTASSPFNTWSATTAAAGNTYLFRRGTTLHFDFRSVAHVKYGAWYNSDGSDDETQPKPVIITTTPVSDLRSANKDQVEISHWDIRASLPVSGDAYVIFCGDGAKITGCDISSNVGCIAVDGKSNVTIEGNRMSGLMSPPNTSSNCVLRAASDAAQALASLVIRNNKIRHHGGGGPQAHAVRVEGHPANPVQGLIIDGNVVGPATDVPVDISAFNSAADVLDRLSGPGVNHDPGSTRTITWPRCPNPNAIGLRLVNCMGAIISNNQITGMLSGIFFVGGAPQGSMIAKNTCIANNYFGIHVTSDTTSCVIEHNVCSHNGTATFDDVLQAYGRGIELSSSAGQGSCTNHTVRFNTCEYNLNYGGPNDNASEGVGIGLDDGTCGCTVYGNLLRFNEGNGVQINGNLAGATDTSNRVVGNFFHNNCSAAYLKRRAGGKEQSIFAAQLDCSSAHGGATLLADNVFSGKSPAGLHVGGNSNGVTVTNNLFVDASHCVMLPKNCTSDICVVRHNTFFSRVGQSQKFCTDECDANGVPMFNPFSADPERPGAGNRTFEALVAATYPD